MFFIVSAEKNALNFIGSISLTDATTVLIQTSIKTLNITWRKNLRVLSYKHLHLMKYKSKRKKITQKLKMKLRFAKIKILH